MRVYDVRHFLPNLDFESQCLNPGRPLSGSARRAVDDLAPVMGLLASDGDSVQLNADRLPRDIPPALAHVNFVDAAPTDATELVPWGWSLLACELAASLAPKQIVPASDVVAYVNGRNFHDLIDGVRPDVTGAALEPFGAFCQTPNEWRDAVSTAFQHTATRIVTKALISNAGRNRLFSESAQCNSQQEGWLNQQFSSGGCYVEPWHDIQNEYSMHFDVNVSGDITFVGCTEQVVDNFGRPLGNIVSPHITDKLHRRLSGAKVICRELHNLGYFGPVGIDGYTFQQNDELWLRPCSDINARYSMGRLALAAHERLGSPDEAGCMLTLRQATSFRDTYDRVQTTCDSLGCSTTRISPLAVGDRDIMTGAVYISGSDKAIASAIARIHSMV